MPVLQTGSTLFGAEPGAWATPMLPQLLGNTVELALGVVAGAGIIGTALAWLTSLYRFPGRDWLVTALALPLAMPAYVLAFVLLGAFETSGPVLTAGRALFGADVRLPSPGSGAGLTVALVLAFYPHVYLLARNAFLQRSIPIMEAARSLGAGPWTVFFRVSLPLAWPWIGAGLALVSIETLAEFGAVSLYGYETFTTAIYRTGVGLDLPLAGRLSALLLLFTLLVAGAEQSLRLRQRRRQAATPRARVRTRRLDGWRAVMATAAAGSVLMLAFVLPVTQIVIWGVVGLLSPDDSQFFEPALNTLMLAGAGAALIATGALVLGWRYRDRAARPARLVVRLASLGYAMPGVAVAIAVYSVLAELEGSAGGHASALSLIGGLSGLLAAYVIRFLAAGFGAIDKGIERLTPGMEAAARSLGVKGYALWRRLYAPLLLGGLFEAWILAMVEIARELPATLLLRPDGWDTLAVRTYAYAVQGNWQRASLPAMALVGIGLIPVLLLARAAERHR